MSSASVYIKLLLSRAMTAPELNEIIRCFLADTAATNVDCSFCKHSEPPPHPLLPHSPTCPRLTARRADSPVFTKIFKVNRKSDEASQALAICTHGVAGAKYFELPLPAPSPFNAVLGTKPKVVYFGATQADLQTDQALIVLHPWISQAFAYYLIAKHKFFENQGLGIQLVYSGAHSGCGNVAAIEVIEPLRAHAVGTQVTQNGRRGTLLFAVAAGDKAYAALPTVPLLRRELCR